MAKLLEEFAYYFQGETVELLRLLPCIENGLMDFDSPYKSTIERVNSVHVLWTLKNISFSKGLRFVIGDADFYCLFRGENVFELA